MERTVSPGTAILKQNSFERCFRQTVFQNQFPQFVGKDVGQPDFAFLLLLWRSRLYSRFSQARLSQGRWCFRPSPCLHTHLVNRKDPSADEQSCLESQRDISHRYATESQHRNRFFVFDLTIPADPTSAASNRRSGDFLSISRRTLSILTWHHSATAMCLSDQQWANGQNEGVDYKIIWLLCDAWEKEMKHDFRECEEAYAPDDKTDFAHFISLVWSKTRNPPRVQPSHNGRSDPCTKFYSLRRR